MEEFIIEVSVEATRTYRIVAKNRKEALKELFKDDFYYEVDYTLGSFDDESQINREWNRKL